MSALLRANRPAVSVRTQRLSVAPRVAQLRSRAQSVVARATEETGSVDTEKLIDDLKARWEAIDNKPLFLAYTAAAVAGLWLTSSVLSAVDRVPLIPKSLEFVGLGYSAWFTYKYLLFKSGREALIKELEDLKNKITGPAEETTTE